MAKKRSIGITIVSIYLFFTGVTSLISGSLGNVHKITSIIFGIFTIICAFGIFRLRGWGRKATIILLIFGIINTFLYFSPIFHKQRMQQLENRYIQIENSNSSKYLINDKEVTKEEFLESHRKKIERYQKASFDFMGMLPALFVFGLILLFLNRPRIKEQFENKKL